MTKATPEDLLNTVIAADALRRRALGQTPARYRPSQRVWIEPFFNVLGHLWAFVMACMPSPVRRPFVQWVNCKMGGYFPIANPDLPQRKEETVRLAQEIKQKTGQWPALLVLTSHPNTEGPHQWLRFELLRQGLQIADAVVEAQQPGAWYPGHPRCLLAIDPYALDTVSPPIGGFYSAWMHRIYVAWDRQPSTQSWFQKHFLLRHSGYSKIAWKFLKLLKADIPVLMVLAGGLPFNARLLYAAREFVHRLPVKRWTLAKRQAQIELMEILMQPEGGVWPAVTGMLPAGKVNAIRNALNRWGLSVQESELALKEFQEEFKFPVPYRERLFRVLMNRLVSHGKPLLLVAISHSETPPRVQISLPVAVTSVPEDIPAFARQLVTTKFL